MLHNTEQIGGGITEHRVCLLKKYYIYIYIYQEFSHRQSSRGTACKNPRGGEEGLLTSWYCQLEKKAMHTDMS